MNIHYSSKCKNLDAQQNHHTGEVWGGSGEKREKKKCSLIVEFIAVGRYKNQKYKKTSKGTRQIHVRHVYWWLLKKMTQIQL